MKKPFVWLLDCSIAGVPEKQRFDPKNDDEQYKQLNQPEKKENTHKK